jgi:hypothetical protein
LSRGQFYLGRRLSIGLKLNQIKTTASDADRATIFLDAPLQDAVDKPKSNPVTPMESLWHTESPEAFYHGLA